MAKNTNIKRGDIFYASLNPAIGSEQGGFRPVLILQNNVGNANAPTTIVAPITKSPTKSVIPTHCMIDTTNTPLKEDSMILFEQIRTIDKSRLKRKVGHIDDYTYSQIDEYLKISLGISNKTNEIIKMEDVE